MVDRTRKTKTVPATSIDIVYSSLKDAAGEIARLIEVYGENAMIDHYTPAYSDGEYLYVYTDVPETDAEMDQRIKLEEKREAERKARELAEFERLSKLYGKG